MIFFIGDDQVKGGYFFILSYIFIVFNVLVFLYQVFFFGLGFEQFVYIYGSIFKEIMVGQDLFIFFISMFLYGSWMYLIGNMVFLWIFVDNIEVIIGMGCFFMFYFFGGLVVYVGYIYFNLGSFVFIVGVSGVIFVVMGVYLIMFFILCIKMLVFIFFVCILVFLFLGFWIFQQVMLGNQFL